MGFKEDLAAAKKAPANTADVDVLVNGRKYTLRFKQVTGQEWAEAVDRSPLRREVALDVRYGYNLRMAVGLTVPNSATLLDGEKPVEVTVDEDAKPPVNEWADLLDALSGFDFQRVTDAVWQLNEWDPQQALEAAKKAPRVSGKSSR
jgi:hypothetical protein